MISIYFNRTLLDIFLIYASTTSIEKCDRLLSFQTLMIVSLTLYIKLVAGALEINRTYNILFSTIPLK